jgi:type II secretory pathway pseudopilin PulG
MERLHQIYHNLRLHHRRGASLVELLLAIGLAAVLLPALAAGFATSTQGRSQRLARTDAISYMREAQEAVRSVRERGWTAFAVNGTYHPVTQNGAWQLVTGVQTIDEYTRSILIEDVQRNSSGQIVTSGGTVDPSTKKVTMNVGWDMPYSSQTTSTIYVTRYLENLSYIQTSAADYNSGIKSLVDVTTTGDGELRLAINNRGQWCQPNLSLASLDLPGVPDHLTAIEGHVYVSTGQTTQASQVSFAHVLVDYNANPPTSQLAGTIRGYRTTGVFGESSYAYIATTNDTREVVIINLTAMDDVPNKIYHQEGWFNATGSTDAQTVFVSGTRGYMTAGEYLYVFNLTSKTGSRPMIGTRISFANSGDTAGAIYVNESGGQIYAYIAVGGSTPDELKIVNVTNPSISSQWRVVGGINIEPNNCSALESGKAVFVKPDGTRAYISSVNDTSFKEFFTLNTSNKAAPSLLGGFASNPPCTNGGGYEAGGMDPRQSVIVSLAENRAILVGVDATGDAINSKEYQVLDMTNESTPTLCGSMQFDQGIYGVAAVKELDGDAYSYIITGDGAAELKIIQGGSDGTYQESGTYESAIFDTGYSTAFNRFTATSVNPANTSLRYQFATADAVSGSCASSNYVYTGPDGTNSTYYATSSAALALNDNGSGYENPARCLRYKAFFSTTDYNVTPELQHMTVNYSP